MLALWGLLQTAMLDFLTLLAYLNYWNPYPFFISEQLLQGLLGQTAAKESRILLLIWISNID